MTGKKYHISPETGRPNLCNAKIACRFGLTQDKHYDSKEEARAGYEEQMKALTVPKLSKEKLEKSIEDSNLDNEVKRLLKAAAARELQEQEDEEIRRIQNKHFSKVFKQEFNTNRINQESMVYAIENIVRDNVTESNPGCPGCRPGDYEYSDYCRCGEMSFNNNYLNESEIAESLFRNNAKQGYRHSSLSDSERQVVDKLTEIVEKHNLGNTKYFDVKISGGYYGEEFEGVELNSEGNKQVAKAVDDMRALVNVY